MDNQELKQEIISKVLDADFKNIVEKVKNGKTLNSTERKTLEEHKGKSKWEVLDIHKTTYYKYKKLGMPESFDEAREWIRLRNGMARQGSGKIEIGGRSFDAQALIDIRGKLMEEQAHNVSLKNRIEKLNVLEREGKLVDSDIATSTILQVLHPLKKALDQMPENLCSALNPDDPERAEAILEQHLQLIYADLQKSINNQKVNNDGTN
jgi:hypothetical protein